MPPDLNCFAGVKRKAPWPDTSVKSAHFGGLPAVLALPVPVLSPAVKQAKFEFVEI